MNPEKWEFPDEGRAPKAQQASKVEEGHRVPTESPDRVKRSVIEVTTGCSANAAGEENIRENREKDKSSGWPL